MADGSMPGHWPDHWYLDSAINHLASQPLFDAEAIVTATAEALQTRFSRHWPADLPNYPRALECAAKLIREAAYGSLEMVTLRGAAEKLKAEREAAQEEES